jgi:pimeloyl-ACP methyl ester carboxylesterase
MKIKILVLSLVLSLLLNVAGVIFFVLYLGTQGKYNGAKRHSRQMEHYLDAIAMERLSKQSGDRIQKRSFVSHVDGRIDTFGLIAPLTPFKDGCLVVYLHGMASSYIEPFVVPHGDPIADRLTNRNPSLVFMSCNYRDSQSWGSDAALSDITQNIHEVLAQYPIKKIVLMGTSMGGCTSLIYAELAPPDIKDRIAGVVSVEAAGDLTKLYNECRGHSIANAMFWALGGSPEQVPAAYNKRSFIQNLYLLPRSIRIVEVSARDDEIVPPQFQHEIVDALQSKQYNVKLIEVDGQHGAPASEIYAQGFDYVTGN